MLIALWHELMQTLSKISDLLRVQIQTTRDGWISLQNLTKWQLMLVRLHVPYCNVRNFLTERKKICDRDKKITNSMWSKVAA